MTRTPFNDGWTVAPKRSIFAQLSGPGEEATAVVLPHDALIGEQRSPDGAAKSGYFPQSAAYAYSKRFDAPAEWSDKRVTLRLDGAYRDAIVFINGVVAGGRSYGYNAFTVPMDDHLRLGASNTVRVEVRAHDDARWYTGAGITRGATLLVDGLIHTAVDGVQITTPDVDDEQATIAIRVVVVNASTRAGTVTLTADVVDPDGRVVASGTSPVTLRAGSEETARIRTVVPAPRRWSVETPALYSVRTRLLDGEDVVEERTGSFGIRTLRLDPVHGLRINDETVLLRGACVHHDHGPLGAAVFLRSEERRVELMKAAGFNAIRSAHNPASAALLDACDRLGMLVMDEAFDVWTESKSSFDHSVAFADQWERDVEAMVAQDFNHPSVILYSIGNEIPETGTPLGSQIGRRIAEHVRRLDPTRFVTNGINGFVSVIDDVVAMMQQHGAGGGGGVNEAMGSAADMMNRVSSSDLVTGRTAESMAVLDVVGLNYGDARYEQDRQAFPNRILVGSETFPSRTDALWRLVTDNGHVIGDFTWTGWDYLGEVGIGRPRYLGDDAAFEAPFPWRSAWCGDFDIIGGRRTVSYYRETVFGLRHEPFLAVHRPETRGRTQLESGWAWSDTLGSWTWPVAAGTPLTVDVYSDAEEIELLLNGRSLGRATVGAQRAYQAGFEVDYEPGELVAVAYADGRETARTRLVSAAGDSRVTVRAERDEVGVGVGDLAYLAIEVRDGSGVLDTSTEALVHVDVSGPGVLQGLSSGRPDSEESFHGTSCTTFDGRALAVVRPTGSGDIVISVRTDGQEAVTATVRAELA